MVKLQAIVYHKKHNLIAAQNIEKYVYETLKSKIDDKFDEVQAVGMYIREGNKINLVVHIEKGTTKVRLGVIKNNLRKLMKNFSKRYNTKCHVV